ncbi:hypothetical protein MN0502_31010 [Arthrobacter sp. MN05-02]|nr:hypothetical protein MN0502_31010 [Arthrobacter sp. MN05-02]
MKKSYHSIVVPTIVPARTLRSAALMPRRPVGSARSEANAMKNPFVFRCVLLILRAVDARRRRLGAIEYEIVYEW